MKKIILVIKLILRSKFIFKTPKKHDLILFDDVSFNDMKNVISGFNYFILQARGELVTKVYISFKIFRSYPFRFCLRLPPLYDFPSSLVRNMEAL